MRSFREFFSIVNRQWYSEQRLTVIGINVMVEKNVSRHIIVLVDRVVHCSISNDNGLSAVDSMRQFRRHLIVPLNSSLPIECDFLGRILFRYQWKSNKSIRMIFSIKLKITVDFFT